MVWRQLIWFHDCQWHQFWFRFADKVPNFQPNVDKKLEWLGTNGSAGASSMMQHDLSDPDEGYPMVWRQLIWFHDCYNGISFGSDLLTKCQTFSNDLLPKNWNGLAPMSQQDQAA
jgi:hypothetical protein